MKAQDWIEIGKLALASLPFLILCIIQIKINKPKDKRHLQALFPVVALIYAIVTLILVDKINNVVLKYTYKLFDFLVGLSEKYDFLSFLNFVKNINLAFIITMLSNAAILLGFILIKSIVMVPASSALSKAESFNKFAAGSFYLYDEEENKWYAKKYTPHAHLMMKWIYSGALIFSVLLLIVTMYMTNKQLMSAALYPACGLLVIGELMCFTKGKPKDDYRAADETVEPDAKEEPDYEELRKVFEEYNPSRIAASNSVLPISGKKRSAEDLIKEYEDAYLEEESYNSRLMALYFGSKLEEGYTLDDGLLTATMDILEGKSVLFLTPFFEDTTNYIFFPIVKHLMKNEKMLVILGRNGAETGIEKWLKEGISKINGFEDIWNISLMANADDDTSIAILPMKDIYNQKLINDHAQFFSDASLVIVIDATRLLGTMQVGLSNIVSRLKNGKKPQYIAFDRNCDGLVDSLSHVLNVSIERVHASSSGESGSGVIVWNVDGKNTHYQLGLDIARYLGMGTELMALAIKNKVSEVSWLSYEKFPITDMHWIVKQYYASLCKVMGLSISQTSIDAVMKFYNDMWSLKHTENSYIVAEDEYNNAFEIARMFSTRADRQSFIHILSPNYWLKDYMCENAEIFIHDPKAIPSISPDYQRTKRNMVYRIVIRLIEGEVSESELSEDFELIDCEYTDIFEGIINLLVEYFIKFENPEITEEDARKTAGKALETEVKTMVNPKTYATTKETYYSLCDENFINRFLSQLKVSYYIAEDETDRNNYLGSILYGHVYQKYLPGMFFVLDGKYYEVVSITKRNGVIIRRAADHITGRKYYRQIRTYKVDGYNLSSETASQRSYGNILVERGEADVTAKTHGYYLMSNYGDIKNASKVYLNNIEDRVYKKKSVIRIKFEDSTPQIRFTIAELLNEMFITVFPDMHEYISATVYVPEDKREEYSAYIPAVDIPEDDGYIYIVEDSLTDLGLLINTDRYFVRFIEIICDVLSWHFDKLKGPSDKGADDKGADQEPITPEKPGENAEPTDQTEPIPGGKKEKSKKKKKIEGIFSKQFKASFAVKLKIKSSGEYKKLISDAQNGIISEDEFIRSVNAMIASLNEKKGKKSKKTDHDDHESDQGGDEYAEDGAGEDSEYNEEFGEEENDDNKDGGSEDSELMNKSIPYMRSRSHIVLKNDTSPEDDSSDNDDEIGGYDTETLEPSEVVYEADEKLPYEKRFYYLFGYEEIPEMFDLQGTLDYLNEHGFGNNYLHQVREGFKKKKRRWFNYSGEPGEHFCDFCGALLDPETTTLLGDGREQCPDCAKTAVYKLKQFKVIYKDTRKQMTDIFGIKIRDKIKINSVSATEIAQEFGEVFNPTPGYDGRTLGFARDEGRGHRMIYIENGSPEIAVRTTIIHELTHIWQYENLMNTDLFNPRDLVAIEGMAVWAEAQYLSCIGEKERSDAYIEGRSSCNDEYGKGMVAYIGRYPIKNGSTARNGTPFECKHNPLR